VKLDSWPARAAIGIGLALFRLWVKTLRFRIEDPAQVIPASRERPLILAVWHNRLLLLPPVFSLCFPHRRSVGLISASRDGDIVSMVVDSFGHGTVRGSTSRKGVIALRQLVDKLAAGENVLITPDGPRGPLYEVNQGIIYVAQKSGAAIVPMHLEFGSAWRMKSWDGFFVPKPFSQVRVIFGQPHEVADDLEAERLRLQNAMLALVEQR
jgi:hypothetical protein